MEFLEWKRKIKQERVKKEADQRKERIEETAAGERGKKLSVEERKREVED